MTSASIVLPPGAPKLTCRQVSALLALRGVTVTRGGAHHWLTGHRIVPLYAVDALSDVLGLAVGERERLRQVATARAYRVPVRRGAA